MTQAQAAFKIWKIWREAKDEKWFTNDVLSSICDEEEEEWQNTFLKLSEQEGKNFLKELGLTTMPNSGDEK